MPAPRQPALVPAGPRKAAAPRRKPEEALQRGVLQLAAMYNVRSAHFRPGMTAKGRWVTAVQGDGKGFPDLVLVGSRLIVRELKVDGETPTPEQRVWIAAFRAAGVDADVWHTADLLSGRIEAELAAIRRPAPYATPRTRR